MKLSRYPFGGKVVRDGKFETLGYVDSKLENTLVYADTIKYLQIALLNPAVSCIITVLALADSIPATCGLVLSPSPRDTFYKIHTRLVEENRYTMPFEPHIGTSCKIHPSAIIGANCRIGDNTKIGENVVIRDCVWIGSDVSIDAGVTLGVDGILYNNTEEAMETIPHAGYVRIHDRVSIMASAIVVRSIHNTDLTEIGPGALIGLGCIIGHEAKVGECAIISNQCLVARRANVGKRAFIGTNSMIAEHIIIGAKARVMAGSVVINDVAAEDAVSGNFASGHKRRMLEFVRGNKK